MALLAALALGLILSGCQNPAQSRVTGPGAVEAALAAGLSIQEAGSATSLYVNICARCL